MAQYRFYFFNMLDGEITGSDSEDVVQKKNGDPFFMILDSESGEMVLQTERIDVEEIVIDDDDQEEDQED